MGLGRPVAKDDCWVYEKPGDDLRIEGRIVLEPDHKSPERMHVWHQFDEDRCWHLNSWDAMQGLMREGYVFVGTVKRINIDLVWDARRDWRL